VKSRNEGDQRREVDPDHEEDESYIERGGPFDPEVFDVQAATKAMRKGLPNWWEMD
jgi:hypothetical protein